MIPTDSDYLSTVVVTQIRTDALEDILEHMYTRYNKLGREIIMVTEELSRRKTCTL